MKKLALITLLTFIGFSSFATTNNPIKESKNEKLRNEITSILQSPTLNFESNSVKAVVTFTVTPKGEIIVLDVASNNKAIKPYLISKLNYKKISHKTKKYGVVYIMPFKIVKEK